jgi:hypothetical protein
LFNPRKACGVQTSAEGVSAFKRAAIFAEAVAMASTPLPLTASLALFMIRQSNGEIPFVTSF